MSPRSSKTPCAHTYFATYISYQRRIVELTSKPTDFLVLAAIAALTKLPTFLFLDLRTARGVMGEVTVAVEGPDAKGEKMVECASGQSKGRSTGEERDSSIRVSETCLRLQSSPCAKKPSNPNRGETTRYFPTPQLFLSEPKNLTFMPEGRLKGRRVITIHDQIPTLHNVQRSEQNPLTPEPLKISAPETPIPQPYKRSQIKPPTPQPRAYSKDRDNNYTQIAKIGLESNTKPNAKLGTQNASQNPGGGLSIVVRAVNGLV